jgi:hypothetical protein
LKVCLKAADWVVFFEGCPEVVDQLQAWFCGTAWRRASALTKAVPEPGLPMVDFLPDAVSTAKGKLPLCGLVECPVDATRTF